MKTKTYPDGWSRQVKTFNSYTVARYVELHRPDGFPVDAWYSRFPRLRASLGWRRHSTYGRWHTAICVLDAAAGYLIAAAFLGRASAFAWLVPWAAAIVIGFVLTKEKNRGRHRQTQADHRDPGNPTCAQGSAGGTAQGAGSGLTFQQLVNQQVAANYQQMMNQFLWGTTAAVPIVSTTGGDVHALEVVKNDMPILAHRWAHLDFTSEPRFRSLNATSGTFGVHATAECRGVATFYATSHHEAPQPDCQCGFYAVPADVLPDWDQGGAVELQVQLSGRVIEHERGYRAQHQTVLSAVAPSCVCGKPSVRAWIYKGGVGTWDCGDHDVAGYGVAVALTLGDLSSALGVPFKGGDQ